MSKKWRDKVPPSPKIIEIDPASTDEAPTVIMLVTGEDADGNPQWAYAKILAQNFLPFKIAEEEGNYNLSDFGEILKFGAGKEPPEDVRREMQEKHGCDENFEDSFAQIMEKVITAFNDTSEAEDKS